MNRRLWPAVFAAGLGVFILCGLGMWQLQRLAWKEALLDEIEERTARLPISLAEAAGSADGNAIEEFTKLRVEGRSMPERSLFVISTFEGGAGWTVVTPLRTKEGLTVLVDRGTIPDGGRAQVLAEASRDETVTGVVRKRGNGRAFFDPDNDPAGNIWYWWDMPAMVAAAAGDAPGRSLPFILQRIPEGTNRGLPRPAAPEAGFRNTHLQYAVTWFALAAALAAIAFFAIRLNRKRAA